MVKWQSSLSSADWKNSWLHDARQHAAAPTGLLHDRRPQVAAPNRLFHDARQQVAAPNGLLHDTRQELETMQSLVAAARLRSLLRIHRGHALTRKAERD